MEFSAHDVREVQFREKMRGYHQDDVDGFLVRVAGAIEHLERRLTDAEGRAAANEARVAELSGTEEALRRTLVLAQRTADLALTEARDEASRLLTEACVERDRLVQESDMLRRELIDESQEQIRAELAALEVRRDQLVADVDALATFLAAERERLSTMLAEARSHLDDGSFAMAERPALLVEPAAPVEPPPAPSAAQNTEPEPAPAVELGDDQPPTEEVAAITNGFDSGRDIVPVAVDLRGFEMLDANEVEDAFLAELRLAVTDEEPLGPRGDDHSDLDRDAEEIDFFARERDASGRLGSRLRRRR